MPVYLPNKMKVDMGYDSYIYKISFPLLALYDYLAKYNPKTNKSVINIFGVDTGRIFIG